MKRKIKFGFILPSGERLDLPKDLPPDKQFDLIKKAAKAAETLNYDSIWITDHFHPTHPKPELSCVRMLDHPFGSGDGDRKNQAGADCYVQLLQKPGITR
jgi:alkanesulfonate monooxygenase SsuD/methylene tetrahydromethanopterin reductase-like flavin-dependent oxidoreductase (luciferase family)